LVQRSDTPTPPVGIGWRDRLARRLLLSRLSGLAHGELVIEDGDGVWRCGRNAGVLPELTARIRVRDPAFYRLVALRGALGAAEAYMEGLWDAEDLPAVVRLVARSEDVLAGLDRGLARLARPGLRLLHAARANDRRGSRRNIESHYDLGDEFFALFLDESWTYSCAVFEAPGASLADAQRAKYDRVAHKLALAPGDHVLEIGGGWGGFAVHAAQTRGCRVTTTTISRAQFERARERVARAGLADRVRVLLEDYRDLRGHFDKLVSIEMIEAVGHRFLGDYFRAVGDRLSTTGLAVIQAITTPDQSYERSRRSVDFIKRYVFPGGQLPSHGAMLEAVRRETDLRLLHLEDLSDHYVRTLHAWRERFLASAQRVVELGYTERFRRMWDFYLAYCEGGFAERAVGVCQLVLEKRLGRRPPLAGAPS
jgi:cyclopropane-fatty-acyl-phospholipid synthase